MRRSELFLTASKQTEVDTRCRGAELAAQSGLVHNYGSGTFGYSTIGKKVLDNIEEVIHEEMEVIGGQEVKMNLLQTSDMWRKSGRWKNFEGEEFFYFKNRDDKDFCLAPTHEEAVVELVQSYVRSYRNLGFTLYQIGRKFRDDHARNGLLRSKEFVMKDAYSFHGDEEGLQGTYLEMLQAYRNIFNRLGLEYSVVAADTGSMGGSESHEFLAEADIGSDTYLKCQNNECEFGTKDLETEECQRCGSELREVSGIEIDHLFKLGTRYSDSMDLTFDTQDGESKAVVMGCYGIGVSRLIAAIIQQNHDDRGITWNSEVAAFKTAVIAARHEEEAQEKAEEIYSQLNSDDTLLHDDSQSAGERFAEADLIGVHAKIIVGRNFLENGKVEIEYRNGDKIEVDAEEVIDVIS